MRIKTLVYTVIFSVSCLSLAAQATDVSSPAKEPTETQKQIAKWIADLYTFGVDVSADSLIVSGEVEQLMHDEDLRKVMYPEKYDWPVALQLMDKMQLKRAFWYFINMYQDPEKQELVMKAVLRYDGIFSMDVALLSAFYTYAMLDPAVSEITPDGHIKVTRPDLVEAKLRTVKEMIQYVKYYRTTQSQHE